MASKERNESYDKIIHFPSLHTDNSDFSLQEISPFLPQERPSRAVLEKYRTDPSWFINPAQVNARLHDIGHHARVVIWIAVISKLLYEHEGIEVDEEALEWAGASHDTKRLNDMELLGGQRAHAYRQAAWVKENWQLFDPNLSQQTVDKIALLVHEHSEWNIKVNEFANEQNVFRHADRLDIVRGPGVHSPLIPQIANTLVKNVFIASTEKKMDYPWAIPLVPIARMLATESRSDREMYWEDQFATTLDAAQRLGIITA